MINKKFFLFKHFKTTSFEVVFFSNLINWYFCFNYFLDFE
tara:strand:+ start:3017 stop:3136 length:120 start_codon:yes stop_codon:yes gene_type:complete